MQVDGQCHCGAIAFAAEIDPERVRICHCTDCQTLSGTAFRVTAPCDETEFKLLRGAPRIYVKVADSGSRRQQAFCADCGSPLYATSDEPPGARKIGIRVGVLTQARCWRPGGSISFARCSPGCHRFQGKSFTTGSGRPKPATIGVGYSGTTTGVAAGGTVSVAR
jgi:hypothetical protein